MIDSWLTFITKMHQVKFYSYIFYIILYFILYFILYYIYDET